MNAIANYGARRAIAAPSLATITIKYPTITSRCALKTASRSWVCSDCARARTRPQQSELQLSIARSRKLSTSTSRLDEARNPQSPLIPKQSQDVDDNTASQASLPSNADKRRWQLSRRLSHIMDNILAKASMYGQHINVYTGTDYSGIETLKRDINTQEERVDACHSLISTARATHHEAHAKQAASQKEIVSLLERKSSWSPEDLERYMSLVRSEHTDEQAVQAARDGLAATERDLGIARAELERLERKQYHEEQIWSDTIRRNSTWITFVLMGVNITLLLAQIAIFEPWRRRKIVKEVNAALEGRSISWSESERVGVERMVDEVVEPKGVLLEVVEEVPLEAGQVDASIQALQVDTPLPSDSRMVDDATGPSDPGLSTASQRKKAETWAKSWDAYKESLQDMFSERIVQMKKVDVTTTALQGAATGVAAMGLLFVLWRPK